PQRRNLTDRSSPPSLDSRRPGTQGGGARADWIPFRGRFKSSSLFLRPAVVLVIFCGGVDCV
uniref:Uncharacterized protein n=1 Tax=Aegilops tauschii subsp. strangulata TaxID=200361 RepID=A0A453CG85_AEGTS